MITQVPLPESGSGSLSFWKSQIESAKANLETLAQQRNWNDNIKAYLGQGDRKKWGKNTTLVRKDYSLTEIKKALLFYQLPDVSATAKNPKFAQAEALVGAVVNQFLSPDYTNAMAMVDEVLMDILCPAGVGVSKLGYEAFVDPNLREIPVPNPANPAMPALNPDGSPVMAPNVVRESYFWNRIPPKMFLFPPTFIGSDFDQAGWVGFKYTLAKPVAERLFELTKEQLDGGTTVDLEKDLLASDVTRSAAQSEEREKVTFYEIWYRASQVDPMIGDPEIIRQLVMLEGSDEAPLVHRDSPYQQIEDGKMIAGMKGYPVHVFTIRYVSDQAIPPSDCSASRDQVDELSQGRTQMIDQRDRSKTLIAYDSTRVPQPSIDKYLNGDTQELIGIPGFDAGQPPFAPINKGQFPRENFTFNDIVGRDIAETWALGANQQGVETDTRRTATELSLAQGGSDTRMDKERGRFLQCFGKGCQKLLALIQLFADQQDFARVADEQGQMTLRAWDKTAIAGDYGIVLAPDSSQRIDAAVEKKRAVDMFQTFGNDPLINQVELRKVVLRKLGLDANKLVREPQPKPPEKPQVSVLLKGEDMSPAVPQYLNVTTLLAALGIGVQPPTPQAAPPPQMATNPGGVPPVSPIGKRSNEEQATGQLPGAGQAADVGMVAGA